MRWREEGKASKLKNTSISQICLTIRMHFNQILTTLAEFFKEGNIDKLRNHCPLDSDGPFLFPHLLLLDLFFPLIMTPNAHVKDKNVLINKTSGNEAIS